MILDSFVSVKRLGIGARARSRRFRRAASIAHCATLNDDVPGCGLEMNSADERQVRWYEAVWRLNDVGSTDAHCCLVTTGAGAGSLTWGSQQLAT